jgi:Dipeptidyl aminopeptidases/acylaminoacyl-peptidases
MSFLQDELTKRDLPQLLTMNNGTSCIPGTWRKRRLELLDILSKNLYGYTPKAPDSVSGDIVKVDNDAFAGKVIQKTINLKFETPKGEFSFPFYLMIPKNVENPSVFLHIAFEPDIPEKYMPVEEITDNGYAIAMFCYNDVVQDSHDGNYNQGLAAMYMSGNERKPDEWGRIGMWAFAASRVMDYLWNCGEVNRYRVAVTGHSRLGKTALWTAAQDERFYMAVSNNSGFAGAAIAKRGTGERVIDFIRIGSWDWFCETFKTYHGNEDENNVYEQHMLLAAIAPRHICVGSAERDRGADPKSEFLSCVNASEVYELLGHYGLVTPDEYPTPPTKLFDGKIGYHIREGTHYFSRTDWLRYMEFFK